MEWTLYAKEGVQIVDRRLWRVWKSSKQLVVKMDEESSLPLLTPQAESQIRVRHLWFFLFAGLLVIIIGYCLFINNIFILRTLKCPADELINCGTKVQKSRWKRRGPEKSCCCENSIKSLHPLLIVLIQMWFYNWFSNTSPSSVSHPNIRILLIKSSSNFDDQMPPESTSPLIYHDDQWHETFMPL